MITFSAAGGSLENSEIACQSCRQRKLKCSRAKPKCDTCARLQHRCEYSERKRPLGRKSQYTMENDARPASFAASVVPDEHESMPSVPATATSSGDLGLDSFFEFDLDLPVLPSQQASTPLGNFAGQELIELGLREALPPQELIDELHHLFFAKFYPVVPMIHEYRYYTSLTRAPLARPPICLRYAIWASAASFSDKYKSFEDLLYRRARRYLDASEMKGEGFVNVYYAQTWCLIAMLEAKNARFSQSWMSVGRAVRLVQMLGLYAIDVERGDAKQVLPPAQDWIELEERRRTFWTAFYGDRWASVLTGWPTTINENEILTNLPVSELSFEFGLAEETKPFAEAFSPRGLGQISSFSALLLVTKLYGHNREHLNINSPNECVEDIENGEFWKRHRRLDNALLNTFLYLPDSLRLPHGINDMNTAFVHMSIHASSIKLHQGAIAAAMKHGISSDIIRHSQVRALTAAEEITNIMRQIDNVDVDLLNSWTGFCLYVAASVLIKDQQSDQLFGQGLGNLSYLLSAMQKIGQRHNITEHFFRQIRRDMIAAGLNKFGEGLNDGQSLRTNSNNPISSVDDSPSNYHQFSIPEQTFTNQSISDPNFKAVEIMWDLPIDHPMQFPTRTLSTTTSRIGIQETSIAQDAPSVRSAETISDSIPGSSAHSNQFVHTQPISLLPMRDHEQVFVGSDRGYVEGAPGLDSTQKTDIATEYSESHIVNPNYYSEDFFSGQDQ